MRFDFTEDQRLLQQTVRDFLEGECAPDVVRAFWQTETGRSRALWSQLAELGIIGLLVPEVHEGLGMDEVDFVLPCEELGRAGLAEPVISTAAVGARLLAECGNEVLVARWLKPLAVGEVIVAVGHPIHPLVADAHVADLLLLSAGDAVHAMAPEAVTLVRQKANDPARWLFSVDWAATPATLVADGAAGRALLDAALDRAALACAAQQLGVCDRLISEAVAYASQRQQFGKPIGGFQAVKHRLADAKVKLEYARPLVYRAAHSVASTNARRAVHVSMAKVAASEAAVNAAKAALQVHGAIGYTWEQDLHIWMRRAWSLDAAWGLRRFHRQRMADFSLAPEAPLGPGRSFI